MELQPWASDLAVSGLGSLFGSGVMGPRDHGAQGSGLSGLGALAMIHSLGSAGLPIRRSSWAPQQLNLA